MKNMKKILSLFLVLGLCLSLFPTAALAEGEEGTPAEENPVGLDVPGDPENGDGGLSGSLAPAEDDPAALPVTDDIQYIYYFATDPSSEFDAANSCYHLSWVLSFYPTKVTIGYYDEGHVHESSYWRVTDTISGNLNYSMNFDLPLAHVYNWMYVRAYYDGEHYAEEGVWVDFNLLKFETEASYVFQAYNQAYCFSWETSFSPSKVEIGYYDTSSSAWTVLHTEWAMSQIVRYGFTAPYVGQNLYVRAYYGATQYVESKGTNNYSPEFKSTPGYTTLDPNCPLTLSWRTNFIPLKVQIGYFSGNDWYAVAELTSGLSTSMSHTLPYNHVDERMYIRAWYGSEFYLQSDCIDIYLMPYQFSTSPTGGTVSPGGSITLQWKTNFVPTRIRFGYYNDGGTWVNSGEITSGLQASMSYDMAYGSAYAGKMYVRAFYNNGAEYAESTGFTITKVPYKFLTNPTGGTVNPGESITLQWKTNFVPTRIVIGSYNTNDAWVSKVTLTSDLQASMSYDLSYDKTSESTMYVRAYSSSSNYVESAGFSINKVPRQFLTVPADATVNPEGSLILRWKTNFVPTAVQLGYYSGASWVSIRSITTGLQKSMNCGLGYSSAYNGTMYVRAYYNTSSYVESAGFVITKVPRQFTVQPEGGAVYPTTSLSVSWTTNFTPTKIQIGCLNGSSWVAKSTLTGGLQKNMTTSLSYSDAVEGNMYVRAFYDESSSVTSAAFPVQKSEVFICGDNVTATLSADGCLTLSGSGPMWDFNGTTNPPPWYEVRDTITRLVIPGSVTRIGSFAFCGCQNLYTVDLAPETAFVGAFAFQDCSALSYVNYDGFRAQWEAISIESGNSRLTDAYRSYLYRSGSLGSSGVDWELDGSNGRLTISGTGGSGISIAAPWRQWGQWITEIEIQYGVDTIWEDAFGDCPNVLTVYLPGNLSLVEEGAFGLCTSLADVYYDGPSHDWEYLQRSRIRSDNDPLLNATLHTAAHVEGLTADLSWSVDDNGLLRIFVDPSLGGSGDETDIPDYSAGTAPWYADYASDIVAVRLESGVTGIGKYSLSHLPYLQTVEIADTVSFIGNYAFEDDGMLAEIIIPDGLTQIGNGAFQRSGLTQLHLPDSVTTIGGAAFNKCTKLTKVWLPAQLSAIPKSCFADCWKLQMVSIPISVTSVGQSAFSSCSALIAEGGEVYYGGTSAQYAAISGIANQSYLLNAWVVHFVPEELAVNERNFPDPVFRAYVSDNIDTDHSGWLTDAEIAAVTSIDVSATEVLSLQGIQYFSSELEQLDFHDTGVSEVDLSANTELRRLVCYSSQLAALDLSSNTALEDLDCDGSQNLASLNVSGLTHLGYIDISDCGLTELDVSDCPLSYLECDHNPLETLILGEQDGLTYLCCYAVELARLDISGCPYLLDAWLNGTHEEQSWGLQVNGIDSLGGYMELDKTVKVVTGLTEIYVVTFDARGHGTTPAFQTVLDGECAAEPEAPTEEGWSFEGWYLDADCTEPYAFTTPVTTDLTLYAKWTQITYSVSFESNGHGTAPEAQTVPHGDCAAEPEAPTVEGWSFEGWYLDADCTVPYAFTTPVTADLTLYAKWTQVYIPGDINGDGTVNNKDVIRLQKYLKNPTTTVNAAALDVNGDGKVNNKDLIRLTRWPKYHDVEIH